MTASFTATEYEALEAGLYPAQLLSIEQQASDTYGDFLKWTFKLRLADGSYTELSAASSMATGPKSKAYKWAAALLGQAPQPGAAQDLAGKVCSLNIIVNEDGFNRVDAVLPMNQPGLAPGTAPDAPPVRIEPTAAPDALPF